MLMDPNEFELVHEETPPSGRYEPIMVLQGLTSISASKRWQIKFTSEADDLGDFQEAVLRLASGELIQLDWRESSPWRIGVWADGDSDHLSVVRETIQALRLASEDIEHIPLDVFLPMLFEPAWDEEV